MRSGDEKEFDTTFERLMGQCVVPVVLVREPLSRPGGERECLDRSRNLIT